MFAILKQFAGRDIEIIGEGVVEVLQDGFGFLRSPDANYLAGPGRHLRLALADPPIRPAHRRHRRRPDPQPQGGRALFRAAESQLDQFRRPGKGPAQGPLRQFDAALSRRRLKLEIEDPTRKDLSARVIDIVAPIGMGQRALIVAPPRTGKTVLLQNIAQSITHQSSGMLSDRAAHRRAAGRSDRHAALGAAAKSCPPPSTSRRFAMCRSPRW